MLKHLILTLTLLTLLTLAAPVAAWQVVVEQRKDQPDLTLVEQRGSQGSYLVLVCLNKRVHVEIDVPANVGKFDAVLPMQVDNKAPIQIEGFFEKVDRKSSVFIGLTRRGTPTPGAQQLTQAMKSGNVIRLILEGKEVERWSLKGSSRAISTMMSRCV